MTFIFCKARENSLEELLILQTFLQRLVLLFQRPHGPVGSFAQCVPNGTDSEV